MAEIVSGVGADSKRTDNNISSRVAKIQREAKIQNATGGTYGQAKELTALAQGESTNVPTPAMGGMTGPTAGVALNVTKNTNPPIDVFGPGNPNVPETDGAPGLTPGRQPGELNTPIAGPNELSILARAIYASNPTPMWRRVVEAFDEEGV
jgi:hypothetical protein